MKNLLFLSMVLMIVGCDVNTLKGENDFRENMININELIHHNFVLTRFNGKFIEAKNMRPNIEFGENLNINGSMCNYFTGQGVYFNGVLTVKKMTTTEKNCINPVLNELDHVIVQMLQQGVEISLSSTSSLTTSMTLKTDLYTLHYDLKDWIY